MTFTKLFAAKRHLSNFARPTRPSSELRAGDASIVKVPAMAVGSTDTAGGFSLMTDGFWKEEQRRSLLQEVAAMVRILLTHAHHVESTWYIHRPYTSIKSRT